MPTLLAYAISIMVVYVFASKCASTMQNSDSSQPQFCAMVDFDDAIIQ